MSYVHYTVAKGRGVPFWRICGARMKGLLSVYNAGPQEWNFTKDKLAAIREHGLTAAEREAAAPFVQNFRERPERPTGMRTRDHLPIADMGDIERLAQYSERYRTDRNNPTLTSPASALRQ